ncbi:hypothetical protein M431DRAFT_505316 [Trichoderma harzianum CBS 226.95]|uniref:Uncharacterized protein n=1 Tax=Trichoderma harzianum CBS 226.95 TaxID=983964 RepID=A0A2T4ALM9_TRIHA|nr:hypothetical protein M431DRAFT_505316 [Trichoderma harzianum CBS 226.95]PTB57748.1 hypothetical protein M431DRAFT_505316 [Trichoderma harzianum CBS 226.95]
MKSGNFLRFLMAVPFVYGHGLQKEPRFLSGHETMSSEDFDHLIPQIPSCAVGDTGRRTMIVFKKLTDFGDFSSTV